MILVIRYSIKVLTEADRRIIMKMMYTAGELAKVTGVSYKTIRHYHSIGLLQEDRVGENGYRYYGIDTIYKLQRILMLKYLNFSLDEIRSMIDNEENSNIYKKQIEYIKAQQNHLDKILEAVEELDKLDSSNSWDKIIEIIRLTMQKEEIMNQYKDATNLRKRMNIHEYSTAKTPWYTWVLERLNIKENMEILEIGAGYGSLWTTMIESIPRNVTMTLTDRSNEMLVEAKKQIEKIPHWKEKNIRFTYEVRDVEKGITDGKKYDRIIANHMLYHISNDAREAVFRDSCDMLKEKGVFFATTVGETHFQELFLLGKEIDARIVNPSWMAADFTLENGRDQILKYYTKVFVEEHENDLLVPEPMAIYDYLCSLPCDNKKILEKIKEKAILYLTSKVSKETPYYIHKSTGAIWAIKNGT